MSRRALFTLATVMASGLLLAPPAAAALVGIPSSNFVTRLERVEPRVPGVELRVIEFGNRLELVNRTNTEVVVSGYEDEPYLRVGPAGVFENRRSPTTYLNRNRQGTEPMPENADAAAAPDWRRVSSARVARWYDHRVHWMGAINPPAVRQTPDERHVVIPDWTVDMRHGEAAVRATGALVWEPGPSPWPWFLLAAVPLGVATLLLGTALWMGRRSSWMRPLAIAVGLLLAVSVAATVGRARFSPGTGVLTGSGAVLVLVWVAAGAAVVLLLRQRPAGLVLAAVVAVAIGTAGGILDVADLSRSQVPSSLPEGLARAAVAWSLGLGTTVALGAVLALRQSRPVAGPEPAATH